VSNLAQIFWKAKGIERGTKRASEMKVLVDLLE